MMPRRSRPRRRTHNRPTRQSVVRGDVALVDAAVSRGAVVRRGAVIRARFEVPVRPRHPVVLWSSFSFPFCLSARLAFRLSRPSLTLPASQEMTFIDRVRSPRANDARCSVDELHTIIEQAGPGESPYRDSRQ
jgi:hypothetical protein